MSIPPENADALDLLHQWQSEDPAYDREAWARLTGARVSDGDLWLERFFWRWDGRRQARFYRRWKRALRRHEERYRDMHPAPILCMDSPQAPWLEQLYRRWKAWRTGTSE